MRLSYKTVVLAAMTSLVAMSSAADDVRSASERVVACQAIEDPMQKLACFEAAADTVSEALAEPEAPIADPVPAPQAPVTSAAADALVSEAATASQAPIPQDPDPVLAASSAAEPAEQAPKGRVLPSWIPRISLGGGDEDKTADPDSFDISVTRIQRNNVGRHFFTTADGQVWRQVEVDDVTPPSGLPAPARLKRGMLGSIRLVFDEHPRDTYSVVRVE